MNKSLHTNIHTADISAIAAHDPLVFRDQPAGKARATHLPQAPSSCIAPQAIGKPAVQ